MKKYDGIDIRVDKKTIGIDLDCCIENGKLTDWAAEIVSHFKNTYIEISPSGTGLRILLFTYVGYIYDKNTYYIKKGNVEVYAAGATNRFVTITGGVHLENEITENMDTLQWLLDKYMKCKTTKKSTEELQDHRESKKEFEQAQSRISKLDTIIQRLYEDNIEGNIRDERFMKMSATYEAEQNQLTQRVAELEHIIDAAGEKSSNADSFLRLVKTYTDIKELNAEIIRTFIKKVYVYGNEKPWDRNTKKIKVIFNFIGEVHIPSNVKTA